MRDRSLKCALRAMSICTTRIYCFVSGPAAKSGGEHSRRSAKRKQRYVDRQTGSQSILYVHRPGAAYSAVEPGGNSPHAHGHLPEARLTTPHEKALTTLVDNIQHIESTSYNGVSVVPNLGKSRESGTERSAANQFLLAFQKDNFGRQLAHLLAVGRSLRKPALPGKNGA